MWLLLGLSWRAGTFLWLVVSIGQHLVDQLAGSVLGAIVQ